MPEENQIQTRQAPSSMQAMFAAPTTYLLIGLITGIALTYYLVNQKKGGL